LAEKVKGEAEEQEVDLAIIQNGIACMRLDE